MSDAKVEVATIIEVVCANGDAASMQGHDLTVCPKAAGPRVYRVENGSLGRRSVLQIAKRCGIESRFFWHPEQQPAASVTRSRGDQLSDDDTANETAAAEAKR